MIFKVFFFSDLIEEQSMIINITNEIAVLKAAKKEGLKHIAKLEEVFLGHNHIAIKL
jgi:hypothetical protein